MPLPIIHQCSDPCHICLEKRRKVCKSEAEGVRFTNTNLLVGYYPGKLIVQCIIKYPWVEGRMLSRAKQLRSICLTLYMLWF